MSRRKSKSELKTRSQEHNEVLEEFKTKQVEIELALETLGKHKLEYQAMLANPRGMLKRAAELFAEDQYEGFRYTPEDVEKAVTATRCLEMAPDLANNFLELAMICTLYLANRERRLTISRQLLLMLPDYVDEYRFLDAYLLHTCAVGMVDEPNEINLFLYEMIHGALDLYIKNLQAPPPPPIEVPMPEQPAEAAPSYNIDQSTATVLEQQFINLMDTVDAPALHLAPEEVDYLMPRVYEKLDKTLEALTAQNPDLALTGEGIIEHTIGNTLLDFAASVTSEVFTPKREYQLIGELQAFYLELVNQKSISEANQVAAGLHILQQMEGSIFEIRLLTMLVFDALRRKVASTSRVVNPPE